MSKELRHLLFLFAIFLHPFIVSYGQSLGLEIYSEQKNNQRVIDSLNVKSNFKDYIHLEKETNLVLLKLQRLGYIESTVNSIKKKNDSTYRATYKLGNKWAYLRVFFSTKEVTKKELERISIKATKDYFTIPIKETENILNQINQLKIAQGDPFSSVQLSKLKKNDSLTIYGQLTLSSGNTRRINDIIIKGYEKFPRSFLKHYAGIKKEDIFIQEEVLKKTSLLNNLGFVKSFKPPEALFREKSTSLYLYLKRTNNNLFDGILGFASNQTTQRLEFNGFLNLELNNNLNFGEQLLIHFKADGREQQNFRIKASIPYLFRSPIGLSSELKIFRRDSTFSTTDQQVQLNYQVNPAIKLYGGYKGYTSVNLLREQNTSNTIIEDYKSRFLLFGSSYLRQQSENLFPIKTFLEINGEFGNRESESDNQSQLKITSLLEHLFNLNTQNTIYIGSQLQFLSSDRFLTNELFRFGGINSIRGFNENSIDASFSTVINTEYRYIFNTTTYIHSIVDIGYFENKTTNTKSNLYSFGIGLGLQTAAGIFRFNIANGISESQNFQFSNTKIHLSVTSRF